jgi:hypothetical protein
MINLPSWSTRTNSSSPTSIPASRMAATGKVIWCLEDTFAMPLLRFCWFFTLLTTK